MKDSSEKEEELLLRQALAKTVATTDSKWMKIVAPSFEFTVFIQESADQNFI